MSLDFDLYPYLTGSTQLVHLLPPESQEGGAEAILERLGDSVYRWHLTQILRKPSRHFENIVELAGFDQIYASTLHSEEYKEMTGKSIAEIAKICKEDPYDTLYDILIAEKCQATMLDTIASEEDMLHFLKDPYANVISGRYLSYRREISSESLRRVSKSSCGLCTGKEDFFYRGGCL